MKCRCGKIMKSDVLKHPGRKWFIAYYCEDCNRISDDKVDKTIKTIEKNRKILKEAYKVLNNR